MEMVFTNKNDVAVMAGFVETRAQDRGLFAGWENRLLCNLIGFYEEWV